MRAGHAIGLTIVGAAFFTIAIRRDTTQARPRARRSQGTRSRPLRVDALTRHDCGHSQLSSGLGSTTTRPDQCLQCAWTRRMPGRDCTANRLASSPRGFRNPPPHSPRTDAEMQRIPAARHEMQSAAVHVAVGRTRRRRGPRVSTEAYGSDAGTSCGGDAASARATARQPGRGSGDGPAARTRSTRTALLIIGISRRPVACGAP
jgi:hypothetical protein